jgi:hypothetical protein
LNPIAGRVGERRACTGFHNMARSFVAAGLPVPPVPGALKAGVRRRFAWCWSTKEVDPLKMYACRYVIEALCGCLDEYVAVGTTGHGCNSYFTSYQLIIGRLAVFAQAPAKGAYSLSESCAAELERQFGGIRAVLDASASHPRPARGMLVVVEQGWHGGNSVGWLAQPVATSQEARAWLEHHSVEPQTTFTHALEELRG